MEASIHPLTWDEVLELSHGTEVVYGKFATVASQQGNKKPDHDKKPQQGNKNPQQKVEKCMGKKFGMDIQMPKKATRSIFDPQPASPEGNSPGEMMLNPMNIVTK